MHLITVIKYYNSDGKGGHKSKLTNHDGTSKYISGKEHMFKKLTLYHQGSTEWVSKTGISIRTNPIMINHKGGGRRSYRRDHMSLRRDSSKN